MSVFLPTSQHNTITLVHRNHKKYLYEFIGLTILIYIRFRSVEVPKLALCYDF